MNGTQYSIPFIFYLFFHINFNSLVLSVFRRWVITVNTEKEREREIENNNERNKKIMSSQASQKQNKNHQQQKRRIRASSINTVNISNK